MKKQKNKQSNQPSSEDKDCEKGIYPILKVANFYFPMADIGKKFRVENTYNLPIKDKEMIKRYHDYKEMSVKIDGFNFGFVQQFAQIFWHAIKEYKLDKEYKDCWLCPIRISEFGNELEVDIDILRPLKSKNKKKK
jgi:hypothetical protein